MHDPLVAMLVSWVVMSSTTAALLVWDRRRLDDVGRQRMWHEATLYAAISGLFLPPPLTFGAHLWVTRPWPLWKRLPFALAGAAAALVLSGGLVELVLWALGFEVELNGHQPRRSVPAFGTAAQGG